MNLPRTILVPTDFSESAEKALDQAVELAGALGAKLYLVNAISVPALGIPELGVALTSTMMESTVRANHAELDRLAARWPAAHIEVMLRTGYPRDVIVGLANQLGADLIVMGTHGRRGVRRALLGSIAEAVLRTAPCPVWVIHGPGENAVHRAA